jgi:hypothetical protein
MISFFATASGIDNCYAAKWEMLKKEIRAERTIHEAGTSNAVFGDGIWFLLLSGIPSKYVTLDENRRTEYWFSGRPISRRGLHDGKR